MAAATASAALKPLDPNVIDRIQVDLPDYLKLAEEPKLTVTDRGMTLVTIIVDAGVDEDGNYRSDWTEAALSCYDKNGGNLYLGAWLHKPDDDRITGHYSLNNSYKSSQDHSENIAFLEGELAKLKDEIARNSTSAYFSTGYAGYYPASGMVNTYVFGNSWENYIGAKVVQWLDANDQPVGDPEILLFDIKCSETGNRPVDIGRVPKARIYGAAYEDGADVRMYPKADVQTTINDGEARFVIEDTKKVKNNQVYVGVLPPDNSGDWTCTYTWPGNNTFRAARILTTDAFSGETETFALFNKYLSPDQTEGMFTSSYIVRWTNSKTGRKETSRLDLTAVCGESKPWLYYTGWTPVTNCYLPWNNKDFGFPKNLKEPGWYHFKMEKAGDMPSAESMADGEIYRPVVFNAGAAYYKTTGSSIMRNAYFSDVSDQMQEIERAFEAEPFYEVDGPMGGAEYRGVVWPMDPYEIDHGHTSVTVYRPSFFAGEETINYTVFRWYDANKKPLGTQFLMFTTDTFYRTHITDVGTPEEPVGWPVFVKHPDMNGDFKLYIVMYPQVSDNAIYYDLTLCDIYGNPVQIDASKNYELILPYPNGMTMAECEDYEFEVRHYDNSNPAMGSENFELFKGRNQIQRTKQGLRIKVQHLSPFMVSWEEPAKTFNATFDANGGKWTDGSTTKTVPTDSGDQIAAPADPKRNGYVFKEWSPAVGTMGEKDVTFTASWSVLNYAILCDLDGGEMPEGETNPRTYNINTPTFTIKNPVREGYTFAGWTGTCGKMPKTKVTIRRGTTGTYMLTANWIESEETSYTVNHWQQNIGAGDEQNGDNFTLVQTESFTGRTGDVVTPAVSVYEGFVSPEAAQLTIAADGRAKMDYYYARGEYTVTYLIDGVQDGGTETYDFGESLALREAPVKEGYVFSGWSALPATMPAENLTVTGSFAADTHTVTFVDGNGGTLSEQTVEHGKAAAAPETPEREGYAFIGWDKAFDHVTANLTVTAQWNVLTYTVTFVDGSGGTLSEQTVEHGKAAAAPENPVREGYAFIGWDKDFGVVTCDLTVTAQWDDLICTVVFADGWGHVLSTQTVEYGKAATAPVDPAREGYTFAGWDKDFAKVTSDLTVTAKWEIVTYEVRYDLAGGKLLAENPKTYTVETETFALNNPVKEGCTFMGWTGTGLDGAVKSVAIAKGSTGNRSYTAHWMSADTGLLSVSVGGVEGAIDGTNISILLPYGSSLPSDASQIVINAAEGAAASQPVSSDGGATWTFTVTAADGETSAQYTLSVSVAGRAPVFTKPADKQEVKVCVGEQAVMTVEATDEPAYQWFVDRGNGWEEIPGATGASYTAEPAKLEDDGLRYFCRATNAEGSADSPVFRIRVVRPTVLPQTGDDSQLIFWTALMGITALAVTILMGRRRKYE